MERVYSAAVIGGGPAGLMAAGLLGQGGLPVLLLEKDVYKRQGITRT